MAADEPSMDGFREYRRSRDRSLRNSLVEQHLGLAYHLAARYDGRGQELQDLRQIAVIGLVKAIERFDPDRGTAFATFARPFVVGEIRHHFRDAGWELHVPRPVKDRAMQVRTASEELRRRLGREPHVGDIADETGMTHDEVIEALDASRSTRTKRFESAADDGRATLDVPVHDLDIEVVEQRALLARLLEELDEDRDREIVFARFYEEKTQQQIAEELGVSQVHVSRLLRRIIKDLQAHAPAVTAKLGE